MFWFPLMHLSTSDRFVEATSQCWSIDNYRICSITAPPIKDIQCVVSKLLTLDQMWISCQRFLLRPRLRLTWRLASLLWRWWLLSESAGLLSVFVHRKLRTGSEEEGRVSVNVRHCHALRQAAWEANGHVHICLSPLFWLPPVVWGCVLICV